MCMQVSSFPLSAMFAMCSLFLVVASICQRRLDGLVNGHHVQQSDDAEVKSLLSTASAADADKAVAAV